MHECDKGEGVVKCHPEEVKIGFHKGLKGSRRQYQIPTYFKKFTELQLQQGLNW
jgi:hypothetical protein